MTTRYPHAHSLGHLTGLAGRLFNKLLTRRFSAAGIDMTAEQWGVILAILNHGAMSQGKLAELLYLEKSTISRSVSGLEKRGWVDCQKNAADGRHKLIALTPDATDIAERCSAIAQDVLRDAQAGLSPESLALTLDQLSGVIGQLRALNQH